MALVLSIGKLTGGADSARYYEESVASGREDYYTGNGEARGAWIGSGAEALRLDGPVSEGQLAALLLDGLHPVTGAPLRATSVAVQGFDLTFSAPKSVSVLFAVGDEQVRAAVVRSHEAAVRDALGYLEREAVQVRRGKAGAVKQHAGGLVAAAYRHRTSRAGDPQLHTHVVAANLAQGADGRWTALHAAPMYTHAKTAGYLYQAALRDRLSRELGVQWTRAVRGTGEIAGIPRAIIEHFSQRRLEIRAAMEQLGARSSSAARVAALATRRAKDYAAQESSIHERWQARAAEHGLPKDGVRELLGHETPTPSREELQQLAGLLAGETGLTAEASTFTRRDVLQAWAQAAPPGASVARIEQLADHWLDSDLAVRVDGQPRPVTRTGTIATRRGLRVVDIDDRHTTPGMLAAERRLVDSAAGRASTGVAVVDPPLVEAALASRGHLSSEQQAMVRALTSSGDGVQVVQAKAGAGKTTALDAARDAWQQAGITVQGAALGSFATEELCDAGIDATTIASLLIDVGRPGGGLERGSVLIIDEAGMVGTRTLQRLADHAAAARAKLVLVGDDRQLPEIDAGGAFRGLAARLGAIELHDNYRQRDVDDRTALDAHRDGRPEELLESLRRRGRITVAPDVEQTRESLVRDWWQGAQADGITNVAMIALRRSEVRELNTLARQRIRAAGRLGDTELVIGERAFAVGDRIVTRHNDRRLGVLNGSRGHITTIAAEGAITVRLDRGTEVTLPPNYTTGTRNGQPFLDHGYATTAHGLQGATVQRSYVLGSEDLYREWGYVAFSRHRRELRFYLTAPDPPEPDRADHTIENPLAEIASPLGQTRAKHLAIDLAARGELRLMPDAQLASETAHLREVLATAPAVAAHVLPRIDAERARVAAELRRAIVGLRAAEQQDGPTDTDDHQVGESRIETHRAALRHWRAEAATLETQRAQIIARAGDPDAWIANHHQDVARLAAAEAELARRDELTYSEALRMVTVAPPEHITQKLGQRPSDLSGRRAWDRGARAIESYRHHHGARLAPDTIGLGSAPADPQARGAYLAAKRRIHEAERLLKRDNVTRQAAPRTQTLDR